MRTSAPAAAHSLRGTCTVPGDKAIAQRALILAAVADGDSVITGIPSNGDCLATLRAIEALGAQVEHLPNGALRVHPARPLDGHLGDIITSRSGTAMRLLCGALAGLPIRAVLSGDPQLHRRPMLRVAEPLRAMGADIQLSAGDYAPITIAGARLSGATHQLATPSAQVKSAILLAGMRADTPTTVVEPVRTRDHTERMLRLMGVEVETRRRGDASEVTIRPGVPAGIATRIPGDMSSAAFVLAAAAMTPNSDVVIESVGLNPTRTRILDVLVRMGALIDIEIGTNQNRGDREPMGSVRVRHRALRGVRVDGHESAELIDELPLLAAVATAADGTTEIRGAAELRYKESDRISGIVAGFRAIGADIDELPDGLVVHGPSRLHGGLCDARRDHRLAMAFLVASRHAAGHVHIADAHYATDSFPGFGDVMRTLEVYP